MKIGVIIPDRGDRPIFLENCKRLLLTQTLQPQIIEIIDFAPTDNEKDITKRYRIGYENLRNKDLDVVFLMENDDWYAPNYIEKMCEAWTKFGQPELFGTSFTIYYHLKEKAWFTMNHPTRSSAMNTMIKPDLNFSWCVDNDPYTDIHLWLHSGLKGETFHQSPLLSIGMKHGIGKCGGVNHVDKLERFTNLDTNYDFLRMHLDKKSFEFYTNFNQC